VSAPRLELRGISKAYGGVRALQDVSLGVAPGEVHAVLGENGAGKSTLVRIVTGIEAADAGEVLLDGEPVRFRSPMAARAAGLVDTVTVLRDGRHVATRPATGLEEAEVVRLMVGRDLDRPRGGGGAARPTVGAELLRVEGLTQAGAYEGVSFALHAGEIVALAGLVGAGRTELAQTLFGATAPDSGRVLVEGRKVTPRHPRQMLRLGVAYLPEDRDGEGLVTSRSIVENVVLPIAGRLGRLGFLRPGRERGVARRYAGELQIRCPSVEEAVARLSGGNRQKVVLAKWLAAGLKVLILDEPTHGIDVGTKAQVHGIIRDLASRGLAILLISSDLPEVLALGDRVLVMAAGRLTAEFARGEATEERVMAAAARRPRLAA
jgi:rhamnose transport system ATP-binding protein